MWGGPSEYSDRRLGLVDPRRGQGLEDFFIAVARRDAAVLASLRREPDFELGPGRWGFSLPGLYDYLRSRRGLDLGDYRSFRRRLYQGHLNQSLSEYGARIVVLENRKHVDRNRYALVWQAGDG